MTGLSLTRTTLTVLVAVLLTLPLPSLTTNRIERLLVGGFSLTERKATRRINACTAAAVALPLKVITSAALPEPPELTPISVPPYEIFVPLTPICPAADP